MSKSAVVRAVTSFSNGSTNTSTLFTLPAIPTILAEWASLLPLVCHLATWSYGHRIVGDIALRGELRIPLFPRLGVLLGFARLLSNDGNFLDEASSKAGRSDVVYDVKWGSVFPCANGAASQIISNMAVARAGPSTILPDIASPFPFLQDCTRKELQQQSEAPATTPESFSSDSTKPPSAINYEDTTTKFRRYQTLHVLHFARYHTCESRPRWPRALMPSFVLPLLRDLILIILIGVLVFAGAHGTATIILTSVLTTALCRLMKVEVRRPPGYLSNNESGDGCMLVGMHQNANVWYLYAGDRGTVDAVLNKTMITFVGPTVFLSTCFYIAHAVQLLAMTFVAAQKGFDGVFLLLLMLFTWVFEWLTGDAVQARKWLRREKISLVTRSFRFTGRMPLIGTVQLYSKTSNTSWMDSIISKCPRREAWLQGLISLRSISCESVTQHGNLFVQREGESSWLTSNIGRAWGAFAIVSKELDQALAQQPTRV
jgi:hypothetical protein